MRGNEKYARFSRTYFDEEYLGFEKLLNNPDLLLESDELGFISALWLYMTPQYPKPSAHEVVTGFFEPNAVDIQNSVGNNFGTTIAIFGKSKDLL